MTALFAHEHPERVETMPHSCISYAAQSIGDYGGRAGRLDVPEDLACGIADAGIDLAVSSDIQVDHGAVLSRRSCSATSLRSRSCQCSSTPSHRRSHPLRRVRLLGEAIRRHLAGLDHKILLFASGGLSQNPPVPRLATADAAQRAGLIGDGPLSPEARNARQQRVIEAVKDFAAGTADIQDLAPDWDRELMRILAAGDLAPRGAWSGRDDPARGQLLPRGAHMDPPTPQ
ncbi:MAG: hypothetical protein EKK42_08260 [Pseudonocardiaceae bacterium]|nr:MAG: hypothetical protein EKK42_08260 [Pseudonocardiaceae bacterium]